MELWRSSLKKLVVPGLRPESPEERPELALRVST